MLAITVDVDWAPDPIVDAVVAIFEEASVPVTLFCTDPDTDFSRQSSSLFGRYHPRNELALHPNFASPSSPEAVFDGLLSHYPNAKGFRSHNGYGSWPISQSALRHGLRYQVECTVFPVDIPPFKLVENTEYYVLATRFADARMLSAKEFQWSLTELGLAGAESNPDELFILAFHPNIVFYDIVTSEEYEDRKPTYHQVRERDSFRHKMPRGPVKLIRELLETVDRGLFTTIDDYARARRLWE